MKHIKTTALLGLASGICTSGGFGQIHEAAELVAGHPIWTHEFADLALVDRLAARALEIVPGLAPWCERIKAEPGRWKEIEDACVAAIGEGFDIHEGAAERTESPLESLHRIAPHADVIVVAPTPASEA